MQTNVAPTIVTGPLQVDIRLRQLGLDLQLLDDARLAWAAASASTTPFQPITAPGMQGWIEAVGVLREGLAQRGWRSKDVRCWPIAIAPDEALAVTVTSGDELTGVVAPTQPTTKNPKGAVIANAVHANLMQLELPYGASLQTLVPEAGRPRETPMTWFLLIASTPEELRAELSLPAQIRGKWIASWVERIILPPIPRTTGATVQLPEELAEDAPEIDVPVARKT